MEYFKDKMYKENKKLLFLKLPENVQVKWGENFIEVSGPLGTIIKQKENILFLRKGAILYMLIEESLASFYWSLIRSLIIGVVKGYSIKMRLIGVGYRARLDNVQKALYLKLGLSHEAIYKIPEDIEIECSKIKGTFFNC